MGTIARRMPLLLSVNVGMPRSIRAKTGVTGIDKLPTPDPVSVSAPGPTRPGGSGLQGDVICDTESHGGDEQAVYAYAREDLDWWQRERDVALRSGVFGENLTTLDLDVTGALIGERWRIGDRVLLQVTCPRIPCATFAAWMDDRRWLKTFTRRARPGAYLRVLEPGPVRAGDPVTVEARPDHEVSIGMVFRALTLESELLPGLLAARDYLPAEAVDRAERRQPFSIV